MLIPKKIIVTSKQNLKAKYGKNFSVIDKLLSNIAKADKKKNLDTRIVYIDDAASAKKAGIKSIKSVTKQQAKRAIDDLYKKLLPSYIAIFGAADIIPFQELKNSVPYDPGSDADQYVPSDLPYACDAGYSTDISSFTGPNRVVGRIPDITGKADLNYIKKIIGAIIKHKPIEAKSFENYFSVTASVWQKSTEESLTQMFGNNSKLKLCPPATIPYTATDLKPLAHFYNCHGSPEDSNFYGQKENDYPVAMNAAALKGKITYGTVVAAECCYGAELYNPANEGNHQNSIANTYLENNAVAFVGSSTIAYGPAAGQGLADLITQYFIINILSGASSGRAFLDARQKFLSVSSQLDPYELKTLGQFYLLGDPSLQPVVKKEMKSGEETIQNRRLKLFKRGVDLSASVQTSFRIERPQMKISRPALSQIKDIFKETGFTGKEKQYVFKVEPKSEKVSAFAKSITQSENVTFRVFIPQTIKVVEDMNIFEVLVLKESGGKLLGWQLYHRK